MKITGRWITEGRRAWVVLTAVVLAGCVAGAMMTQDAMEHLPYLNHQGGGQGLVDQQPWKTAQALAPLAVSAEEVNFAREAERLADHEVDQAFAMALRLASARTPALTGEALSLSQKVKTLQQTVKDDQAQVAELTRQSPNGTANADSMEIARAQMGLDQDELTDAQQDLARASGDQRTEIQQELTAREAEMKKYDSGAGNNAQIAVLSAARYGTLYGRIRAFVSQRSRYNLLLQARQEAKHAAESLAKQRDLLTGEAGKTSNRSVAAQQAADSGGPAISKEQKLAQIGEMAAQRSAMAILGDRQQTEEQLAMVYDRWAQQVTLQHRIVLHLMLQSFAWIALVLLLAALTGAVVRAVLRRATVERRRAMTLQTISELAIQLVALLLIVLVVFGAPSQAPTILGLLTAGLTVVFQDFILAFFGWFVLMGKNGIRVGDQVEINGIGGEVVEIGLFRTAVLETGNWTPKGHPTGRRTTFVNKFAVAGQYFNFSTAGQWLWDEIKLGVPRSKDVYQTVEAIHQIAVKETEKDAQQAEAEWKVAANQKMVSRFGAAPSVEVRPAAAGLDVVVRYVTRAADRLDVRNRIYTAVVNLLDEPVSEAVEKA